MVCLDFRRVAPVTVISGPSSNLPLGSGAPIRPVYKPEAILKGFSFKLASNLAGRFLACCLVRLLVPLTAILQGSVLKKRTFGGGALLRCQKRERKAHFLLRGAPKTRLQGAPNSQHGSPRRLLSTRRRLSTLDFRLTALPLSTSTPSRLSKLAIRLPLVWTARPRVRLWP